jgi:hypothetical protein
MSAYVPSVNRTSEVRHVALAVFRQLKAVISYASPLMVPNRVLAKAITLLKVLIAGDGLIIADLMEATLIESFSRPENR